MQAPEQLKSGKHLDAAALSMVTFNAVRKGDKIAPSDLKVRVGNAAGAARNLARGCMVVHANAATHGCASPLTTSQQAELDAAIATLDKFAAWCLR